MFKGERETYHARVAHALSNEKVLSVHIDIIDSYVLGLPKGGTQYAYPHTVDMALVGALVHGKGYRIFRTNGLYRMIADLICHVTSVVVQEYLADNGTFPEIV